MPSIDGDRLACQDILRYSIGSNECLNECFMNAHFKAKADQARQPPIFKIFVRTKKLFTMREIIPIIMIVLNVLLLESSFGRHNVRSLLLFRTKELQMNRVFIDEYPCIGKAVAHTPNKTQLIYIYIYICMCGTFYVVPLL